MNALEYYVRIGCPIQRRRTPDEFFRRASVRDIASGATADRGMADDHDFQFEPPVRTLLGSKSRLTKKELEAHWQRLSTKSKPLCEPCEANHLRSVFGCFGTISAPISATGERWLIESFTPTAGVDSVLPIRIVESEVTGSNIDIKRGVATDGVALTEALEPAHKKVTPGSKEFSSSQLLEFMMTMGPIVKTDLQFAFLADFGAIDMSADEIETIGSLLDLEKSISESSKTTKFRQKVKNHHDFRFGRYSSDDRSITELKQFFRACYTAFALGGKLVVRTEFSLA